MSCFSFFFFFFFGEKFEVALLFSKALTTLGKGKNYICFEIRGLTQALLFSRRELWLKIDIKRIAKIDKNYLFVPKVTYRRLQPKHLHFVTFSGISANIPSI